MQTGPIIVTGKPRLLKEVRLDEFCGAVDWVSDQDPPAHSDWWKLNQCPRYFRYFTPAHLDALNKGWWQHRRFALRDAGGKGSRPLMIFPDEWVLSLMRRLGLYDVGGLKKYQAVYEDAAVFPGQWMKMPCVGMRAHFLLKEGENEGRPVQIQGFDRQRQVMVKFLDQTSYPNGSWLPPRNVFPCKES